MIDLQDAVVVDLVDIALLQRPYVPVVIEESHTDTVIEARKRVGILVAELLASAGLIALHSVIVTLQTLEMEIDKFKQGVHILYARRTIQSFCAAADAGAAVDLLSGQSLTQFYAGEASQLGCANDATHNRLVNAVGLAILSGTAFTPGAHADFIVFEVRLLHDHADTVGEGQDL